MAKRRPSPRAAGTAKYDILKLFRRPAGIPEPSADKLERILPKGITPLEEVADLAREAYQLRKSADVVAMLPKDIAGKLSRPGPSTRRDLAQLLEDGELTRRADGRYQLANVDEDTLEESDLERWRKWVRDAARAAGWDVARAENNGKPIIMDGVAVVIRHSPNHGRGKSKLPPGGKSGTGGKPWGGRALRASYDPALHRDVAVLATPMRSLEILDDDRAPSLAQTPPPGAFAVAQTPNGRHWYRRWSERKGQWPYQDAQFVASSRERDDTWHERLFDDDGARRAPPVALPTANARDRGLVEMMRKAWREAQTEAERRGMTISPVRDREPGEEG